MTQGGGEGRPSGSHGQRPRARLTTLDELVHRVERFRDERDWRQFHSLKNLAAAIAIEASELQELFVWSSPADEEHIVKTSRAEVEAELADVVIHCANFASAAGIDLGEALEAKINDNEMKYPAAKVRGSATKYDAL